MQNIEFLVFIAFEERVEGTFRKIHRIGGSSFSCKRFLDLMMMQQISALHDKHCRLAFTSYSVNNTVIFDELVKNDRSSYLTCSLSKNYVNQISCFFLRWNKSVVKFSTYIWGLLLQSTIAMNYVQSKPKIWGLCYYRAH